MGGGLNYEASKPTAKFNQEYWAKWERGQVADFPHCKGLYPDCPETPSLTNKNCRTCPKTDEIKKPKLGEE